MARELNLREQLAFALNDIYPAYMVEGRLNYALFLPNVLYYQAAASIGWGRVDEARAILLEARSLEQIPNWIKAKML